MDIWSKLLDVLRDNLWEGIGTIAGLIAMLLGVLFFISPRLRRRLQMWMRTILTSRAARVGAMAAGVVVLALAIFGAGVFIGILRFRCSSVPLEVQLLYDFEDREGILHTDPWGLWASKEVHTLTLSHDKESACSGSRALRLDVELGSDDYEYVGVNALNLNSGDARAVTAWVLIPASEQTKTRTFWSSIIVYGRDNTEAPVVLRSHSREVQPGVWTPIFVGTPTKLVSNSGDSVWDGAITELCVAISCSKQYSGLVFIDDIVIYTD